MKLSDGLVTYHGTAGIEYAACGKPVLVADKGWYQHADFVIYPESRLHYIELLSSDWLSNIDSKKISKNAKIFSGIYFCTPEWQKNLIMPDDSNRSDLEEMIYKDLYKKSELINKEVNLIRTWLDSESFGYHTFKMLSTNSYSLSNIDN